MPGWRSSASSGPLTSMRSNVTSTAWSSQRRRNGRQGENDEHSLMGHPGRARLPLPLGRGMARARRARDGGRGPAGRPGRRPLDAGADPARRRRARAGNPGPRRAVRALFAQTRRYQPDGLGGRDGAAVGLRGLRSVRVGGQMIDREQYTPGPASGAQVRKDGEKWTLILVRELRHSPEKVWEALTDPAQLREW